MPPELSEELARLHRKCPGRLLTADIVLSAAKNKKSALHKHFDWNDSSAANKFRLDQARLLIRSYTTFTLTTNGLPCEVRGVVSLFSDRSSPGGGYRRMQDVVESRDLMSQCLKTATTELESWCSRYEVLVDFVADVRSVLDQYRPIAPVEVKEKEKRVRRTREPAMA